MKKKLIGLIMLLIGIPGLIFAISQIQPIQVNAHGNECRKAQAECNINATNRQCCEGLVCNPFNVHSGNGKCQPEVTPSVIESQEPTVTPTDVPTPTPCVVWKGEFSQPCPTGEPTETPTATPTDTPTPTPTIPPSPHGDGLSDGKSDGHSSSPQVTLPPCTTSTCGWK